MEEIQEINHPKMRKFIRQLLMSEDFVTTKQLSESSGLSVETVHSYGRIFKKFLSKERKNCKTEKGNNSPIVFWKLNPSGRKFFAPRAKMGGDD